VMPEPDSEPWLDDDEPAELPDTSTDEDDVPQIPGSTSGESDEESLSVDARDEDMHAAATKLQAAYRGHRTRLPGLPDESSEGESSEDEGYDQPPLLLHDQIAAGRLLEEQMSDDDAVQQLSQPCVDQVDDSKAVQRLDRASVVEEGVPPASTQPVAMPPDARVRLALRRVRPEARMRNWGRARLVAALQHLDDTDDEEEEEALRETEDEEDQ
jgi:hypothetical protein